jgi:hypothetical protein
MMIPRGWDGVEYCVREGVTKKSTLAVRVGELGALIHLAFTERETGVPVFGFPAPLPLS